MIQSARAMVKTRGWHSTDEKSTVGLRSLPSVSNVLGDPAVIEAAAGLAIEHRTAVVRSAIDAERSHLLRDGGSANISALIDAVCHSFRRLTGAKLRPLINATGVILHTNLGRAPVSAAAAEAMRASAASYVPLELDIDSG